MIGIKELARGCLCGGDAKHIPVIGRERSKASGTYPDELCEQYAKLAITQLYLMGKEEFLTYKKERLQKSIDEQKAKSNSSSQSQVKSEGSARLRPHVLSQQIKGHEDNVTYIGGMRDPYTRQLRARAPATLTIRERLQYRPPLDAEIIQAWSEKANDKESEVPKWIRSGAPLGIEKEIRCCGIFPPSTADDPYAIAEAEQLARGEVLNYKSVSEDFTNAKIELERYKSEGYLVELSKDEVLDTMGHGTISRLGLIVKEKPSGIKRRIIIDLRRSGGNTKASLPEKLVLPRPKDALGSARNIYDLQHFAAAKGPIAREMIVDGDGYYAFIALLFGHKTQHLCFGHELPHFMPGYFNLLLKGTKGNIRPAKKYRLDTKKYPSATIVTDSSPSGLGGILLINNRVIRAFASPVTEDDAVAMGFKLGDSSSQGIVETMAVLVALKHWTKEISACNLTLHVQSDSLVALAITQKLSNSSPALNFLRGELATVCEQANVEHLCHSHPRFGQSGGVRRPKQCPRRTQWSLSLTSPVEECHIQSNVRGNEIESSSKNTGYAGISLLAGVSAGVSKVWKQNDEAKAPWWQSLLSSPARRLADTRQAQGRACIPSELKLPPSLPDEVKPVIKPKGTLQQEKTSKRRDLPKRVTVNNVSKPTLKRAVTLAKSKAAVTKAMRDIEQDYFANSSKAAKTAKRNAVEKILAAAFKSPMPLTVDKIKMLAGTLRDSGYKSAQTSPLLGRHFRLCIKAVNRGQGPAKKATEVPEEQWSALNLFYTAKGTLPPQCATVHPSRMVGESGRLLRSLEEQRDPGICKGGIADNCIERRVHTLRHFEQHDKRRKEGCPETNANATFDATTFAQKDVVDKLEEEIKKFVKGTKVSSKKLEEAVTSLEIKYNDYTKYLPAWVKSNRQQVIHKNCKIILCSPAPLWKTICGWNYYHSDYEFHEGEPDGTRCQKCWASALAQGGTNADAN
eukprot:s1275_g11.t1